ncbi:MAG: PadR family transcriptional regulator [Lachnoclostridium sp.]|jgi:PadR family transcriptional regulator PadR|nr:PadR family transcriptional regulator [Lachnoclostridium sp.]
MVFHTGPALLDAIVLAVVAKDNGGTYGYRITQDVRTIMDVSESTLYPVLRRLQKEKYLTIFDREYNGRNRRYYKLTELGEEKLTEYVIEWRVYSEKISGLFTRVEG